MNPRELEEGRRLNERINRRLRRDAKKARDADIEMSKRLERRYKWGLFKEAVKFLVPAIICMIVIYVLTAALMYKLSHPDSTGDEIIEHWDETLLWEW